MDENFQFYMSKKRQIRCPYCNAEYEAKGINNHQSIFCYMNFPKDYQNNEKWVADSPKTQSKKEIKN